MKPERAAIPLLLPDMPTADELLPYLRRIDDARWYTNFGPLVVELEQVLAAEIPGASGIRVASVANCTLGLELALTALDLPADARVLVPALTFVATAMAIRRSGFVPVVADVDPQSWLLTPHIAREALERHGADCVMPVAAFGCPQDAAAWDAFTRDTGIPVVIDAAAAFGNQSAGERCVVVFSLHATKSFGAGEGGIVVGSAQVAARIRQMSNFGIEIATGHASLLGTNAKMSEYHAAVALAALARWKSSRARRVDLAQRYSAAVLKACPDAVLQKRPSEGVYTIFPLCLPGGSDAEQVRATMARTGIETRRWYVPLLCDHPSLAHAPRAGALETSYSVSRRLIGIPFHLGLTDAMQARICAELSRALR